MMDMELSEESCLQESTPPLFALLFAALVVLLITAAFFPAKSYAEPQEQNSTIITLSQQIRPGTCYDSSAVNETITSIDYISVWDCQIQR